MMAALALAALLVTLGFSSFGGKKSDAIETECGSVRFKYFSYVGDDDFYKQYPLPDEQSFYTTILPGWYSDPSICSNGKGDYFLVASTFCYYPGVPIFHSKDLVNWKQLGNVIDRPSQFKLANSKINDGGLYASSIAFNQANDTYYLISTSVGKGSFWVYTQDPFNGNWSDPVWLPSEVGGIDPSFFFDSDGKTYIVHNQNIDKDYSGHCQIRLHEYDLENNVIKSTKVLVDKGSRPEKKPVWVEAPRLYKVDGKYYLLAAEGGTGLYHSEVVFRSDFVDGEYSPWQGNPILTQKHFVGTNRQDAVTCTGHADILQDEDGQWWGVFLGCRPMNGQDGGFENLGRETFLMKVRWSMDSYPYFNGAEELIPLIQRREGTVRSDKVTFGNFDIVDKFDTQELSPDWMTLRGPLDYKLDKGLVLNFSPESVSGNATPSFVCRRLQHHKFVAETQLELSAKDSTEKAGILLYKNETHNLFFNASKKDNNGELRLVLQMADCGEVTSLAEANVLVVKNCLWMRVVSRGPSYDFLYSTDGVRWTALKERVGSFFLSTAHANGFTGTVVGMYAVKSQTSNQNKQ